MFHLVEIDWGKFRWNRILIDLAIISLCEPYKECELQKKFGAYFLLRVVLVSIGPNLPQMKYQCTVWLEVTWDNIPKDYYFYFFNHKNNNNNSSNKSEQMLFRVCFCPFWLFMPNVVPVKELFVGKGASWKIR